MGIPLSNFEIGTYKNLASKKAGQGEYGLVLFDEAHNLKNQYTKKAIAANNITTDHKVFVTATPMDTPAGSAYFISQVTNLPKDEVYRRMGFDVVEVKDPQTGRPTGEIEIQLAKGVDPADILQNITAIREEMIANGTMLRREFPFFGSLQEANAQLTPDQQAQQAEIDQYWQDVLDSHADGEGRVPPKKKMRIMGERSGELSRWNEINKLDFVFQAAKKDLAEGRKVVILAEGVNPTYIKALGTEIPGFITEIKNRFRAEGIEVAEVYGKADKTAANRAFQDGDVQVLIGTAKSASTGINLDDSRGGSPRTLYVTTPNYSGNVIDQMLGRVSRRNTKTPAQAIFVYNDSISDTRRREIVGNKLATLRAIQHGRIEADPFDTSGVRREGEQQGGQQAPEGQQAPIQAPQEMPRNDKYQFEQISDQAFVVKGDTKPVKGLLGRGGLGGIWMKKHQGWMFPLTKMQEVQDALGMNPELSVRQDVAQPVHPIRDQQRSEIESLGESKERNAMEQIGEYDRSIERLSDQARSAKREYEAKKREVGRRLNEAQATLFGDSPAQQTQTLFEQPGLDVGRDNMQRVLKPLKDRMDALQRQHQDAMAKRDAFIDTVIKAQKGQLTMEFLTKPRMPKTLSERKHASIKSEIRKLNKITGLQNGETVVVRRPADLLEAMKENGEPKMAVDSIMQNALKGSHVEGMHSPFTGKVYFVTDHIAQTPGRVMKLYIHEVGVHYGITKLIKNPMQRYRLLERVYDSVGEAGFRAVFPSKRHYEAYKDFSPAMKGNEYLARISEKMDSGKLLSKREQSAWQKIVDAFRRLFRKVFGSYDRLHDSEIQNIVRASVGNLVQDSQTNTLAENAQRRAERLEKRGEAEDATNKERYVKPGVKQGEQLTLDLSVRGKDGIQEIRHIPIKQSISDKIDYQMADVMIGMKRVQEALAKEYGMEIPDFANAYRSENHMRSKIKYELDQFDGNQGETLLNNLKKLTETGLSEKDIHHYMVAKHAPERNANFRQRYLRELRRKQSEEMQQYIKMHPEIDPATRQAIFDQYAEQQRQLETELSQAQDDATIARLSEELTVLKENIAEAKQRVHEGVAEFETMMQANEAALAEYAETLRKHDFSGIRELDTENKYEYPDEIAQDVVNKYEGMMDAETIENFWTAVREATQFSLAQAMVSGEISHETYVSLRDMYDNYVPLRGWEHGDKADIFDYEQGKGIGDIYNATLKTADGRTSMPAHPIPYIFNMAHSAVVAKNKNQVKQHVLNLARLFPGQDLVYAKKTYLVQNDDGTWGEQVNRPAQELFDAGRVRRKINNAHERRVSAELAKEHEMYVIEGGEKYIVGFHDPSVAQGFFYSADASWAKPFGWYTRRLSAWLTSKNPNWIWANQVRDIQFAATSHWINMAANDPGFVKKFLKNTPVASKAIRRAQTGKADIHKNEIDRYYHEWTSHGGETGYVHMYSLKRIEKQMRRASKEAMEGKGMSAMKKLWRKEMELTETFAKWSENTSRFATYLTARQIKKADGTHKYSIARAIEISKNADVNYDRKGRLTKHFSSIYAFFNPTIQAMKKTVEFGKNNPKRFAVAMMIYSLRGFFESMMFDMFGDEDEEGVRDYDKTAPFLRRFYTMLPTKGITPDWFNLNLSIPDPHNWRGFRAIGSIFYDYYSGRMDADDMLIQSVGAMGEAFSPWSLQGFVNREGGASLRPVVPTILMPAYEWQVNESFTGRRLRPEAFTIEEERAQPRVKQHWQTVNPAIKRATYEIYEAAGGDLGNETKYFLKDGQREQVPWYADINPAMIEHYVNSVFGARGRWYNQLYKTADGIYQTSRNLITDQDTDITTEVSENFTAYDTPIVNRFFRNPVTDVVNREYWDIIREVSNDQRLYRDYVRQNNTEKILEFQRTPRLRDNLMIANQHSTIRGLMESERTLRAQGHDKSADNVRDMYRRMQLELVQEKTRRPQ